MKVSKKIFLIDVITLMPEMFEAFTNFGVVGRGFKKKIVSLNFLNPRDFTADTHKTVDDRAYGGGPGMVMMFDPLIKSIESARAKEKTLGIKKRKVVHLTPKGLKLSHKKVKELSNDIIKPMIDLIASTRTATDKNTEHVLEVKYHILELLKILRDSDVITTSHINQIYESGKENDDEQSNNES